jgi:hypothetical protein
MSTDTTSQSFANEAPETTSPAATPGNEGTTTLNWADDAPRGGRAVMNRVLKDGATVPLFFGQTLIQSLRDVGYNNTTSALCEHVDNAIQAQATEVRIFFREKSRKGERSKKIDAVVYDNGRGMSPTVLKAATAFGGSMSYGNRGGIARFGMGMKTAALSISPVLELYSWQELGAYYSMTLDVEAIGKERANLIELPDARFLDSLPEEITELFRKPLSFPKRVEEQDVFASPEENVQERLGAHGTIVFMPECDRLTYAKSSTLVDHAVKEMARVYRRAIGVGLRLYVNNRLVEAFDPTYWMTNARHVRYLDDQPKQSRLTAARTVGIGRHEGDEEKVEISIKLFRLPIEEWSGLGRKALRNDLRVFDGQVVSILRNGRELFAGSMPRILARHSVTHWLRMQIDFGGELDEAFGVAANKQGVRLRGDVLEAIKTAVGHDISRLIDELKQVQTQQAAERKPSLPSTSEQRAAEADAFQRRDLPPLTPEELEHLDANLAGLATQVKRAGETDEQAFERVKSSKYIIVTKHDEYWPFYDVRHAFDRVILTLNTAHPFYTHLYEPIRSKWAATATDDESVDATVHAENSAQEGLEQGPIVALELMLLSLARTQGRLESTSSEARKLMEEMRREWSDAYRIQLT